MHENSWLIALQIAAAATNLVVAIVIGVVGYQNWRNGRTVARDRNPSIFAFNFIMNLRC